MLLSMVALSVMVPLSSASADSTESKIATQDSKIVSIKEEATKAQVKVDTVSSQVALLKEKQVSMKAEVDKLLSQQKVQSQQVQDLSKHIQERTHTLEEQERSAQTNGSATNYITAVLDSQSLTTEKQQ